MKTTITHLQKLTKVFLIAAFLTIGLKANAQCTADFTYIIDPANNGVVTFSNTSSGSPAVMYQWSFGDGSLSFGTTSVSHTYLTGTYNACLVMYDSTATCNDSICYTFSVTNTTPPPPSCNASFIPYDSAGYGYFWNQSTGTGLTSMWSFGDGSSGTSTGDITHLYASNGTYTICLTVTNSLGTCTSTYCDTLVIGTGTSGMCLGSVNSNFTASDSSGYGVFTNTPTGTGPVYFWDFGDGTSSSVVGSTTHNYATPGTYNVCLTVYETGGTYDSCQYCSYVTISGATAGPCDASFMIIQDSSNLFNYFVYNNSTSSSGSATYFWDFGDGTSSTLQYPSHTYPGSGPYYLCLTITDAAPLFSCTNTFCDTLSAGLAMSAPITITVVNPLATGISEAAIATSLENYPNPFNGSTTIKYSISKDATVELNVTDLLGNRVAVIESCHKSEGSYSAIWNAENVAEGMYLLQMKVNNSTSTRKIVLTK